MPHVSRLKLDNKLYLRIYQQFVIAITPSRNKYNPVLNDVLTKTEKIMLAKRLACVVLLRNRKSYTFIGRHLKVSTSTVRRLHKHMMTGGYDSLLKTKRRSQKHFLVSMFLALTDPRLISARNRSKIFEEHFD